MKVLVIGAGGLIGRAVCAAAATRHEVIPSDRFESKQDRYHQVDLAQVSSIMTALDVSGAEAIINCAGIVDNTEKAMLNVTFTRNLLEACHAASGAKRIVTTGSAAEYGVVDGLPVSETAPIRPTSKYGEAKAEEVLTALRLAKAWHLSLTVARLFNPIGPNMNPRMLIPGIIRQIRDFKSGTLDHLEISRLDARRDYVDVRDASNAIIRLMERPVAHDIYNIGSGQATSNGELIDIVFAQSGLDRRPAIVQTLAEPEPTYAAQADTTRIKSDISWSPAYTLTESIKEVMHATFSEG